MSGPTPNEFEKANQQRQSNLLMQSLLFLKQTRKFWLLPLLVTFVIISLLIVVGGTAAAPFIYTLF